MRIFWDNQADRGTITPSSENVNYPAANLQEPQLSSRWRTADGVKAATLQVDAAARTENEVCFEERTQLVPDSCDLTVAGWTKTDCTAALLSYPPCGLVFSRIICDSALAAYVYRDVEVIGNPVIQCVMQRGTGNKSLFFLNDATLTISRGQINVTWATKEIEAVNGLTKLRYKWITDDMVWVSGVCAGVQPANDNEIIFYPSLIEAAGLYTDISAIQVEDEAWPSPWIDPAVYPTLTRTAGGLTKTVTMPSVLLAKIKLRPWFDYATATGHRIFSWYVGANQHLRMYYVPASDTLAIYWQDGGTARALYTEQFDDGSAHDNINSEIILFIAIRFDQQAGQRFFAIVDGVKQVEDADWSGAPDAKVSAFTTLYVGNELTGIQADSVIHSIALYNWDGVDPGALDTEAAIDAYLAKQGRPFYEFDPTSRIEADAMALLAHNLTGASGITLEGWDDYAEGLLNYFKQAAYVKVDPYLLEFAARKSYQHWKLALDDPNVVIEGAPADTYLEAGRLILAPYLQMPPVELDWSLFDRRSDLRIRTASGQVYGDEGVSLWSAGFSFAFIDEDMLAEIIEMWQAVGIALPVLLIVWEESMERWPPIYAVLDTEPEFPKDSKGALLWQVKLDFTEAK